MGVSRVKMLQRVLILYVLIFNIICTLTEAYRNPTGIGIGVSQPDQGTIWNTDPPNIVAKVHVTMILHGCWCLSKAKISCKCIKSKQQFP